MYFMANFNKITYFLVSFTLYFPEEGKSVFINLQIIKIED